MSKRRYSHMQEIFPEIKEMVAAGKAIEIAAFFGLTGDRPVYDLLKCEGGKEKTAAAGIAPRPKGRPRKDASPEDMVTEQVHKIKRLRMENKLLLDLLRFTGRVRGLELNILSFIVTGKSIRYLLCAVF